MKPMTICALLPVLTILMKSLLSKAYCLWTHRRSFTSCPNSCFLSHFSIFLRGLSAEVNESIISKCFNCIIFIRLFERKYIYEITSVSFDALYLIVSFDSGEI